VTTYRFLIVAGESSGDMYGADVALSLFRKFPGCSVFGVGGQRMREAGVELLSDIRHTAVVGPFKAIGKVGSFFKIFRRLVNRIESEPPTAAILIDFPDFNLPLAKRIKQTGRPVIYYVGPQLWAWREGRIQTIRDRVDKMLVIFPFEEEIYRKALIDVEFVGHPLIDKVRSTKTKDEFCRDAGLDPAKAIVALLPGSRRQEVRYILPTLCQAVRLIGTRKPGTQFVLPVARDLDRKLIDDIVQEVQKEYPIHVVVNDTYNAVRYSRAAIVASGTATLETALLGTPEVIVYRISGAEWLLGRFLLKIRLFGIVNIILGEEVVPELFQDKFTPERVAQATIKLMEDVWVQSKIRGNYETLRRGLGGGNVADRVVEAVARTIRNDQERSGMIS
jgi:lipid-A-disaccharide synthase